MIHGDYPYIVAEGGLDSVTQYELWKAIASSINDDSNFYELSHALGRHNEFPETFVPGPSLGNHDDQGSPAPWTTRRSYPTPSRVPGSAAISPSMGDEQGLTPREVMSERAMTTRWRLPFPDRPEQFSELGWDTYALYRAMVDFRNSRPG